MVGNIVFIYYAAVAVVVVMLGHKYYKIEDKSFVKTVEVFLPIFVALVPVYLTVISPEKAIEVAFPDVEKYINRADDLEKENKELSSNIVNLQKDNTKMKEKNQALGEKKYAEILDTELVVDGLSIKAKNNFLAMVDGENYYQENVLKEVTGKNIQYDEEQNKIFIGNQGINKVDKVKFEDISKILYDGKSFTKYDDQKNEPFSVAGNEYESGFVIESSSYNKDGSYGLFNLDNKYSKIEFDVGKAEETFGSIENAKMKIYLDGEMSEQHDVSAEIASTHYEIPVNKTKTLKIVLNDSRSSFGFYNIIFTK